VGFVVPQKMSKRKKKENNKKPRPAGWPRGKAPHQINERDKEELDKISTKAPNGTKVDHLSGVTGCRGDTASQSNRRGLEGKTRSGGGPEKYGFQWDASFYGDRRSWAK